VERIFSESYREARAKFQTAAETLGLDCQSHVLDLKGVDGEELAVDVVHVGPGDAPQLMIISSGAHGVEGFAGSAIQNGLMSTGWLQSLPEGLAVVLIHALNPHGFSWSRRECEDGSDLTRNITHHLYPAFHNEQYELFHKILVPDDVSATTRESLHREFRQVMQQHNIENPTPILRIGQYAHADGGTYHGRAASWSTQRWMQIVRQYAQSAEDVMIVDIHTGFGECGELSVQNPSYPKTSQGYRTLCDWLGREPYGFSSDGNIIEHRIETFESLHQQCNPGAKVAAMYFEFGTRDPGTYIDPWVRNNWHFHYGDRSSALAVQARRDFADFCYIRSPVWKQQVWEKALLQLSQLRENLYQSSLVSLEKP